MKSEMSVEEIIHKAHPGKCGRCGATIQGHDIESGSIQCPGGIVPGGVWKNPLPVPDSVTGSVTVDSKIELAPDPLPVRCLNCGMLEYDHTLHDGKSFCPARAYTTEWCAPKSPFLLFQFPHNGDLVDAALELSPSDILEGLITLLADCKDCKNMAKSISIMCDLHVTHINQNPKP